jgi:hypothetical protein
MTQRLIGVPYCMICDKTDCADYRHRLEPMPSRPDAGEYAPRVAPTMTPETREELARAVAQSWDESSVRTVDSAVATLAPIIDRLVAERVAAETERCAGIANNYMHDQTNNVGRRIAAAIRST